MKSKPINKLLSFSELHYQRFLKIMELNGIKTYSNCLAFLIDSAYNNIKQTPNDECLKNIQDNIEKLLTIAKENNSMKCRNSTQPTNVWVTANRMTSCHDQMTTTRASYISAQLIRVQTPCKTNRVTNNDTRNISQMQIRIQVANKRWRWHCAVWLSQLYAASRGVRAQQARWWNGICIFGVHTKRKESGTGYKKRTILWSVYKH